jgi:hypothetical protein
MQRRLVGGLLLSVCLLFAASAAEYPNLSAAQGTWIRGYIDVPAGRRYLSLETWKGTGDCDVYIRLGSPPTTTVYTKRSMHTTNLEYLRITDPVPGRYHYGLYAYLAFSGMSFMPRWNTVPYSWYKDMEARVNAERSKVGAVSIWMKGQLNNAAQRHTRDMATHNWFSHTGTDGSTYDSRIADSGYFTGYSTIGCGENIAAGNWCPHFTMDQWMNSSGHRANILNTSCRHIGLGYSYSASSTYKHYWCQDFGYRY